MPAAHGCLRTNAMRVLPAGAGGTSPPGPCRRASPPVAPRRRPPAATATQARAFSLLARRTRGRHSPLSGHWVSPCFLPKPQAFIMPTWHSEKSKRTGSSGSSCAQGCGDVRRHLPARAHVPRQPQASAEPDDVRVERHDQLRRRARASRRRDRLRRAAPSIAGTGSAACTRCRRTAAERNNRRPAGSAGGRMRAARRAQARASKSCRAPRRRPVLVAAPFEEEPLHRTRPFQHLPQDPQQRHQIVAADPAVHHRAHLADAALGIEPAHEGGGMRSHDREAACRSS